MVPKELGKIQLATLRAMEKSTRPYVRRLARIDDQFEKLTEERNQVQGELNCIHTAMDTFVGLRQSWEEELHPEAALTEVNVEEVEAEAKVDLIVTHSGFGE